MEGSCGDGKKMVRLVRVPLSLATVTICSRNTQFVISFLIWSQNYFSTTGFWQSLLTQQETGGEFEKKNSQDGTLQNESLCEMWAIGF